MLGAAGADNVSVSEQELRSEWWPPFVRLEKPLELQDSNKVLQPGRRGVMLRVEGNNVLVDFGRYGIQRLPFDDTDFEQQYEELSKTRSWSSHGLFTKLYGTRFYHPDGWVQLRQEDIAGKDYFLIAYADLQDADDQKLIQQFDRAIYQEWQPDSVGSYLIPLNAPEQASLAELLIDYNVSVPTMPTFLALSHVDTFFHQPVGFTVALIDKNGRLIARYDATDIEDLDRFKSDLSKQISEARKAVSQNQANI